MKKKKEEVNITIISCGDRTHQPTYDALSEENKEIFDDNAEMARKHGLNMGIIDTGIIVFVDEDGYVEITKK